jgi:hypothetical protein
MRPLPLLSTPPAISVAGEPLDALAASRAGDAPPSTNGFELVPTWQARPLRRLRRLPAVAVPVMAVAVLGALSAGREHDARALREPTAAQRSTSAPASPLVVRAATPGRDGWRRAGR